jgi:hypothetical protein
VDDLRCEVPGACPGSTSCCACLCGLLVLTTLHCDCTERQQAAGVPQLQLEREVQCWQHPACVMLSFKRRFQHPL